MNRRRFKRYFSSLLVVLLLFPVNVVGFAQGVDYDETFSNPYFEQQAVATGTGGAVASEHPLASQAAIDIMEAGGNAIDAAIAAHAVHNFTRPFSGGIGGGGMMNMYVAELDEVVTIGHRSMSPEDFDIESFTMEDGTILPSDSRMSSGMAVGVPGAVKAWEEALEEYGTMTFAEVLAPAIRYAREGFAADDNLIREIRENASRFRLYEPTRELFLTEDGQVPEPGTLMKNPDLANAFELIAQHGSSVFYHGEIGEAIVDAVTNPPFVDNPESQWRQDHPLPIPGVMTMEDLAAYTTVHSNPIHTTYRGYDFYGMPPVSSGGLIIGGLLNILEGYDLSSMSETEFLHHYIEASRLVFADYRNYHGDPDHVHVPVDGMMSKSYAEYLRQKIGETAKVGQVAPGNVWPYDEDPTRPFIPLPELEPGFSYDFVGTEGATWDGSKFYVDTSYDTTYELDGNGFGRMEIGARRNSAGRAASNMIMTENMEILVPFRINDFGGDRRLRFWLRADGWNLSSSPHNGYALEIRSGSDEIHLLDRVNGSGGTIARFNHERTTDLQWLRFKVVDNQLSVKLWNDGDEEPSRWNFVHEDDSLTDPGRLLISTVELANTTEGGAFTVGPIELVETDERSMPPGFSHQFTGDAGTPWDADVFTVEVREPTVMDQTGDGYGRIVLGDSQHDYGRAAPTMLAAKNMELTVPYIIDDIGSSRTLRFWLRADDWASNTFPENGYSVEIKSGFDNIRIHKAQDGSQEEIARFSYARSTEEQMLRYKLVGNQISVKIWDSSETEPRDWNFVYTDEDNPVLGEGTFKVSAYEFTNGAGGSFRIGDINVEETDELTITEPGFSYNFAGNEGDAWSSEKFTTLTTRDASQTLTGDGNGNMHLFGNTSYANAIANMKLAKNKEVVIPFEFNDLEEDSDPHLRLWLRADEPSPTVSPRNGIGVDIRPNQNRIRLIKAVNGNNTWFQDISFDGRDEKQMLRFKVVDDQISVKIWNASEMEPSQWMFVTEEPSVDQLGSFMIGAYEFGNTGADITIGEINIIETEERTVIGDLAPGFSYDFAGNAGDPWDASKFITLTTRDATQTLSGDGYGIINLPNNASYANGAANMLPAKNKELLVPFRFNNLTENSNPHLRIWLRSDGNPSPTVSPSNGVGVDIRPSEDRVRLIRAVNGSNTWFHNISKAGTEEEQMLRLRILDNQLFVKVWNAAEEEPTEWTYVTEENNVNTAGTLFIGAYEFGSAGAEVHLGEIRVVEVEESDPIDDPVIETGFAYDFSGDAGTVWDERYFTIDKTDDATVELDGNGFGYMELGDRRWSSARASAIMNPLADGELLVPFSIESGESRDLRFWLRADEFNTSVTPYNGYGVDIRSAWNSIRLVKVSDGGDIQEIARFNHSVTEDLQWLRFKVVGDQISIKVWKDGEEEPAEWNLVEGDNSVSEPGKLLIGAVEYRDGDGAGGFKVGNITVEEMVEGTGTETEETHEISGTTVDLDETVEKSETEVLTEGSYEEGETINLTVADKYGNVVVHTATIVNIGGTGIVVPGYGFLLNNAIGNRTPISAEEGEPNAAAPQMRPLSTMSPTIVMKDGKPVFAGGAPGGLTIPNTVSKILLSYLDRGMSLPEAVESARISQENKISGETVIERSFTETQEYQDLLALGHKFEISNLVQGIGSFNGIAFSEAGEKQAVAEAVRRGGGSAMAFDAEPEGHRPPGQDKRKDEENRRDGDKRRDEENRRDGDKRRDGENRRDNENNGKRVGQN